VFSFSSARRGTAHTGSHRWSRPKAVSACRQDPRVEGARQSVRASSPGQVRSGVQPQPGIQEFARTSWLTGPGCRQRLFRAGTIRVAPRRTAGQLTAHRAGARPNTDVFVRNEWPWTSPRLKVSRSSTLMRLAASHWQGNTVTHQGLQCWLGVRIQVVNEGHAFTSFRIQSTASAMDFATASGIARSPLSLSNACTSIGPCVRRIALAPTLCANCMSRA